MGFFCALRLFDGAYFAHLIVFIILERVIFGLLVVVGFKLIAKIGAF